MCILLTLYKTKFLFTGDIESDGEDYLLSKSIGDITFLKVAHHGSKTSSSEEFLDMVCPKISIISVGINNSYNHPSDIVIDRLNNYKSIIYRTDKMGSITVKNYIFFNTINVYFKDEPRLFSIIKYKRIIFS